ncbi:hypothetical protein EVJ58_g6867 [Rhodofomes roseus]|uniref:RNA-directed DNA polymerase n=1 Tax=Rhodofomes roseus TaxID=34475 RepID=A0A4Y9Y807_9APHY|nr:hypothetical protein EVJ58_g6867 [Rhodofomes roseus]
MTNVSNSDDRQDTRTLADEVRAAGADPDELRAGPSVLEGTGTLREYELPPVEPEHGGRPHGPPLWAATDIELAVRWGIPDYDALANRAGTTRITRNRSTRLRNDPVPRNVRVENNANPDAEIRVADDRTALTISPNGDESAEVPAATEEVAEQMNIPAATEEVAEQKYRPALNIKAESDGTVAGSPEPERGGVTLPVDRDSDGRWSVATGRRSASPMSTTNSATTLTTRSRFFPDWFDLMESDDTDPYGPIPDDWERVEPVDYAEFNELISFYEDSEPTVYEHSPPESSDEEYEQMQLAIARSLQDRGRTYYEASGEASGSSSHHTVPVNAVIVEVKEEPAKTQRYTKAEKGKGVDRDEEQRQFLHDYCRGSSSAPAPVPPPSHRPAAPGPPPDGSDPDRDDSSPEPRRQRKSKKRREPAKPKKDKDHKPKTTRFKRENSQVPDGGFFSATIFDEGSDDGGRPPSPPSSDDGSDSGSSDSSSSTSSGNSSDSSSSSGSGRHRRPSDRRYRRRRRIDQRRLNSAISGIKLKTPFVWDGKADLDLFDHWVYEVETWRELHGLDDRLTLKIIVNFMSDKPSKFFMQHVAMHQREWTLRTLYEALFEYCFPSDFKRKLRDRLMGAKQGRGQKVRDFVRELEKLASRFPDVTGRQLVQIFWSGVHQYLRLYLIERGLDPEVNTIDKMVKHAKRREDSYLAQLHEDREFEGKVAGRKWGRFQNRVNGPQPYKAKDDTSKRSDSVEAKNVNIGKSKGNVPRQDGKSSSKPSKSSSHEKRPPKLSREERDRLRAEGRCFECKDTGHEARNCPLRKKAKAPSVQASSVRFADIDRLAAKARDAAIAVNSVSVNIAEHAEHDEHTHHEAWPHAHAHDMVEYILAMFQSYHGPTDAEQAGMDPAERFSVIPLGDRYELTDWLQPDWPILIHAEDLQRPEIGVYELVQRAVQERTRHGEHRVTAYPEPFSEEEIPIASRWLDSRICAAVPEDLGVDPEGVSVVWDVPAQAYVVYLRDLDLRFCVTHDDITRPEFDAQRVLFDVLSDRAQQVDPELDLEGVLDEPSDDESASHRRRRLLQMQPGVFCGAMTKMNCSSGQRPKPKRTQGRTSKANTIPAVEHTSMRPKDFARNIPKPLIVEVFIQGHSVRALLDTGCMADFLSTTLVDQLRLKKDVLAKPLPVQLAVHGSRSKINFSTTVELAYQDIKCKRRFDIVNLDNYDAILGTPFIFQHKVAISLNPTKIAVGSPVPLPIVGEDATEVSSAAADLLEGSLEPLRETLRKEAEDLCQDPTRTALPPFRDINHTIPLIDEKKIYKWRPSKCPEALKPIWQKKKNSYLESGRWRFASGRNASPMLILPKPAKDGQMGIRTVVDKREDNANTVKLASPLPDIDTILRNVVRHPFWTMVDGKDAYEQIRVDEAQVPRTLFTTPDGTMESLVMQQGDCNAGATYQMVMNHIFAPYIGVFMDVYLDDIIIYSDTVEAHMEHVRIVFSVLRREKFYLSPTKMKFFAKELRILGHIIDRKGIAMDPHKVDSIANWKVPTNKSLLSSFLGAVGFLAPDCPGIRIPMGVLAPLTGATTAWRWNQTHQRAFEQVKDIVSTWRDNRRVALDYSQDAPTINLVTDASLTGASGYISQGDDLKSAKVVTFWSGKFNSAQQNYPVHEQELLAIVESLKRFRGLLHGAKFRICTDHKALEYLMSQKNLSPRQHRWMDVLNEFEFTIHYIPGETNILADALSRIYSDEPLGIQRATSEYVGNETGDAHHDSQSTSTSLRSAAVSILRPVYTGAAAVIEFETPRRSSRIAAKPQTRWDYDSHQRVQEVGTSDPVPESPTHSPAATSPVLEEDLSDNEDHVSTHDDLVDQQVEVDSDTDQRGRTFPTENVPTSIAISGELGMPMPDSLQGRYAEDIFFRRILLAPEQYKDFEVKDGLIYLKRESHRVLCIPDILIGSRRVREIIIKHAHSVLAHLGARKTLQYLREEVWWKSMVDDTTSYCKTCAVCATSKSVNQQPMGLLRTLPVPTRPWQSIGIDFVGPLPESTTLSGSFDMICVVIDHLTSMVHLIPTKQTYGAVQVAEVVFEHIYKLHGLPERIISDRDTLFTSTFWTHLHRLTNTELRLSSAYHPQTDGATERANRTMTQMLRQCVRPDQKDWATRLPMIELAMNTARSDTTGFSPFYLNYGQMPRTLVWDYQSSYPGVQQFVQRMREAIMSAHDAIIEARVRQTQQANKHRRPAPFKQGDLVYLSTKNLRLPKGRARKLVPKYLGPFPIERVVEPGATYKLGLSPELKARGIADAFHASLLRPHVPNDDRRFPGRQFHQLPGFGEQPREWVVERIVTHSGRGAHAEFLVRWSTGDETWVPYHDVRHLQALTEYCEALGITSVSQLSDPPTQPASADDGGDAIEIKCCRLTSAPSVPLVETPREPPLRASHRRNGGQRKTSGDKSLKARDAGMSTAATSDQQRDSPSGCKPCSQATSHCSPCSTTRKHHRAAPCTPYSPARSSPAMTNSANPHQYTAADRVAWDRYAAQFRAFLNGTAPYPGDPPAGYREVYRLSQHFAPLPEEYSSRVVEATRNETHQSAPPTGGYAPGNVQGPGAAMPLTGVAMTGDAFTTFMEHNATMQQQLLGYLKDARGGFDVGTPPFVRHGRGRPYVPNRNGLRGRISSDFREPRSPKGNSRGGAQSRTRRREYRHSDGAGVATGTMQENLARAFGGTSNSQDAIPENHGQTENEDVPRDYDDADQSMQDDDASRM